MTKLNMVERVKHLQVACASLASREKRPNDEGENMKGRREAKRCSPMLLGQDLKFGLVRSRGVSDESNTVKTTSSVRRANYYVPKDP